MSEPLQLKIAGPLGWLMLLVAACAPIRHGHADAAHEWSLFLGGETSEAEARLAAMADDEEANFLLANIALAHGEHDRAASLTAELRRRHPEDVELQLLEHLVQLRGEHPERVLATETSRILRVTRRTPIERPSGICLARHRIES